MTVSEANAEAARAVGLEGHSAIVYECGFSDGSVALILGEFERDGRGKPFARIDFGNIFVCVNAFIMASEIVIPNSALRRN